MMQCIDKMMFEEDFDYLYGQLPERYIHNLDCGSSTYIKLHYIGCIYLTLIYFIQYSDLPLQIKNKKLLELHCKMNFEIGDNFQPILPATDLLGDLYYDITHQDDATYVYYKHISSDELDVFEDDPSAINPNKYGVTIHHQDIYNLTYAITRNDFKNLSLRYLTTADNPHFLKDLRDTFVTLYLSHFSCNDPESDRSLVLVDYIKEN